MVSNSLQSRISAARAVLNIGEEDRVPDSLKIALASPAKIREWSRGEVKKPETFNYRTFKPERDGLFCSAIFGPEQDYTCQCGKYAATRFDGVTCEKCDVEITHSSVRRERMGHIELACPVAHIWFVKSLPSQISHFLGMMQRDVEAVLYFEKYVVLEPGIFAMCGRGTTGGSGIKAVSAGDTIVPELYDEYSSLDPNFNAAIGAEGLLKLLSEVDLDAEIMKIAYGIKHCSARGRMKDLARRLRVLEQFRSSGSRPEWMILKTLPVLPPGLRPLIPLEGERFSSSDINDLYRRVINRNSRLMKVMELNAPDIIVNVEKRMLQEAVDALIDNGRRGKAQTAHNSNRPLKSLADVVKGKSGRFRSNLLGKRVDFSGRTVIVVGPELKLHQCGLPKEMALELFKPWVYNLLEKRDHVQHLRQARKMVMRRTNEVWDCLDEAIKQHPILLNRAPTLHRLGIQAFEPMLVEGSAIQLHPLVCAAFNADFDGDQMAVHVPLSHEAQVEARILMLSSNNLLSPANGSPVILPSQDMVLGLYYLTLEVAGSRGEGTIFASPEEAKLAYESGAVDLQARCKVRIAGPADDQIKRELRSRLYDTTVGRAMLSLSLPPGMLFDQCNETMTKKALGRLIDNCLRYCDQRSTAIFADKLMQLGFNFATKAGISISVDDIVKLPKKKTILDSTEEEASKIRLDHEKGIISADVMDIKITEVWKNAKLEVERSLDEMLFEELEMQLGKEGKLGTALVDADSPVRNKHLNPLFVMLDSGARGTKDNFVQLAGMRGQMVKPNGEIIPTAVKSSFREGMNIHEYFTTTHGSRKGQADSALKTAKSGYLTRRLVDVAHQLLITEKDCGVVDGIGMQQVCDVEGVSVSLGKRALGRVLAKAVKYPDDEREIFPEGELVDENTAEMLDKLQITSVTVRSPVTCRSKSGICSKCYGLDLGRGTIARVGEAVGVIAAQSIGERGTQLTLQTYHTGGVEEPKIPERRCHARHDGKIKLINVNLLRNRMGSAVAVSNDMAVAVQNMNGRALETHRLPYGAVLMVEDGENIRSGGCIYEHDPSSRPVIARHSGMVRYVGINAKNTEIVEGEHVRLVAKSDNVIKDLPKIKFLPRGLKGISIPIQDERKEMLLSYGMTLIVEEGEEVEEGDIIAKLPSDKVRSTDITKGLTTVIDLLEARKPRYPGVLAQASGRINFDGIKRGKEAWVVVDDYGKQYEYKVDRGKIRNFDNGDRVNRGDLLLEGELDPHEILRYRGRKALTKYMVDEVQQVYRSVGADINDKHIEVIIRQMLQRADIIDRGTTDLVEGDLVSLVRIAEANAKTLEEGGEPARCEPVLLGITKAALNSDSVISAASFQETTKVLTEAAIKGARDELLGLKENVIVGKLIPAGTGFHKRILERREVEMMRKQSAAKSSTPPQETDPEVNQ